MTRRRGSVPHLNSDGTYSVRFTATGTDGKRRKVMLNTGCRSKSAAAKRLRQLMAAEEENREKPTAPRAMAFPSYIFLRDHWLTLEVVGNAGREHRAKVRLNHLDRAWGSFKWTEITEEARLRYIKARQDEGAANASIKGELMILSRIQTLALDTKKLRQTDVEVDSWGKGLKVSNTRKTFWSDEEFRRWYAELPERVQPIAEFLYLTGWRIGEVLGLTYGSIDFDGEEVFLTEEQSKNEDGRTLPFTRKLRRLLKERRDYSTLCGVDVLDPTKPLWHYGNGRPITNPIRAFREAAGRCKPVILWGRKAGRRGKTVHDFRRSAVRRMELAGVPRSIAMDLIGHKSESMYLRYGEAMRNPEDRDQAMKKIDDVTPEFRAHPV